VVCKKFSLILIKQFCYILKLLSMKNSLTHTHTHTATQVCTCWSANKNIAMLLTMLAITLIQLPLRAQPWPSWQENTHFTTAPPASTWRSEVLRSGLRTQLNTSALAASENYCWAGVGFSQMNLAGSPIVADMERLTVHDANGVPIVNVGTGYTFDLVNYFRAFGSALVETRYTADYGYATGGTLRSLGGAVTAGPLDAYVGYHSSAGVSIGGIRLYTPGSDHVTDMLFNTCISCSEPAMVFAAGYSQLPGSAIMPFITSVNSSGNIEWTKHYEISFGGVPWNVQVTSISAITPGGGGGRMACAGIAFEPITGESDAVAFVTDNAGNIVWAQKYGEPGIREEFRSVLWSPDSPSTITCVGSSETSVGVLKKLWMAEITVSDGTMYNSRKLSYNGISTDPSSAGNGDLEGIEVKKIMSKGLYVVGCKTRLAGGGSDVFNAVYITDKEFNPNQLILLNRIDPTPLINHYFSGIDFVEYNDYYWAFTTFSNLIGLPTRPLQGNISHSTENLQVCGHVEGLLLDFEDYAATSEPGTIVQSSIMLGETLKMTDFPMNSASDCVFFRQAKPTTAAPSLTLQPNPSRESTTLSSAIPICSITISNTLGETLVQLAVADQSVYTLPLGNLASGTYLCTVQHTDGSRSVQYISKY
jgi:hypothetical protein